jgi:hypothetical protein
MLGSLASASIARRIRFRPVERNLMGSSKSAGGGISAPVQVASAENEHSCLNIVRVYTH